jgi:hypothetical protein
MDRGARTLWRTDGDRDTVGDEDRSAGEVVRGDHRVTLTQRTV